MKTKRLIPSLITLVLIGGGLCVSSPNQACSSDFTKIEPLSKRYDRVSNFTVARVLLNITTTTDWMTLTFPGEETLLGLYVSIIAGEDAPDLRSNVKPKEIDIGKKQYDVTLISVEIIAGLFGLETNTELSLILAKGCLGFSYIEIYNYNLDEPNLVSTVNITHCDPPYSYSLSDSDLLAPNPFFTFESIQRTPQQVFAFYYPWYGNLEWSGEWVHWNDRNHNPNLIQNGTRELASTHYPSLGAYDSTDPDIVRQHIRMAQAAGIDAFISSWWGINTFEDRAFNVLLTQATTTNFHVTIYLETAPYWDLDENIAYSKLLRDLRYIYDNYATHPAFYKANLETKSEPLVFIYVAGAWSVEFWQKLIEQLRTEGKVMQFQGDTMDSTYLKVFDGIHTYFPLFSPDLGEYYTTGFITSRLLQQQTGQVKMFAATVAPGFDATEISPGSDTVPHRDGATFDNVWELATSVGADAILVTSFNEWHEGTEVENSWEFGGQYLETILHWRQFIQPEFQPNGNLTVLNKITTAISLLDWASLVYPGYDILQQANEAIEDSISYYDQENYDAAFLQAKRAIDFILTLKSIITFPEESTSPESTLQVEESPCLKWVTFGMSIGMFVTLVLVGKQKKP